MSDGNVRGITEERISKEYPRGNIKEWPKENVRGMTEGMAGGMSRECPMGMSGNDRERMSDE